jgi:acetolactate decarboxylase
MNQRITVFATIILCFIANYLSAQKTSDVIHYISLNRSIHLGQFDGSISAKELRSFGDFGVGSQEKLLGELVLVDGVAYTIPATGVAKKMPDDAKIPFAAVTFFKADKSITLSNPFKLEELEKFLDSVIVKNSFAAIRITGKFDSLKFRSYVEQQPPYKPVDEVPVREFEKSEIEATIVGFFTPESAEVLNSPRYHFHVIDKNKTTGGHLLRCTVENVKIEIDYASSLNIHLPDPGKVSHIDLDKAKKD